MTARTARALSLLGVGLGLGLAADLVVTWVPARLDATLWLLTWRDVRGGGRMRPAAAVGTGLLIAAPMLLIFGGLFSGADPVFQRTVATLFDVDLGPLAVHVVRTGFVAWVVAGFLRWAFGARRPTRPWPWSGGIAGVTEIGTALAAVAALFLIFIAVQARSLFGGDAFVRAVAGLSYADYARRGFCQLAWVAALSLPLLLAADWAVDTSDPVRLRRFRLLGGAVLGLLGVIVASALFRMTRYTQAYGLTELRLYTSVFMLWLGGIFVWFAATVLRGRRERFVGGALMGALGCLTLLNVANPDATIARVNLGRVGTAGGFDPQYVGALSADALPVVLARMPTLPAAERCALGARLRRCGTTPPADGTCGTCPAPGRRRSSRGRGH